MRRLRRLLGGSLFAKIYLTLLACLAAVAGVSALLVGMGDDDNGWGARRDRFVAAMLKAEDEPRTLQMLLDRFGEALDADIALYAADGRRLAATGDPLPAGIRRDEHDDQDDDRVFMFDLPDGRVVAARAENPFRPGARRPLVWLLAIALVVAAAAYPVVRHLTRRLERLRRGVEDWGGGALSTRVPDGGTDEVAAVARTFNGAADRIEQLMTANRALLANASHELRSPLARLRMAVDMHRRDGDGATRNEIIRNLGELDSLVEEILLASRLSHATSDDSPETFDLLAVVAEEAAHHGLEATGAPVPVSGDRRLVARLARNLMQNAANHGAPPVEVQVQRHGAVASLTVRDHGGGISPADAGRIFEPFYRPAGHAEAAGGWGLGLSLVAQIAARHGGTVRVEQPEGSGALFFVELPVAGAVADGPRTRGVGASRA